MTPSRQRRVLWDVDTQVDFMLPDGKLYVEGAEDTVEAMERLVSAAREAKLVHVASVDDHELTDPEISSHPDFRSTFPAHCLRGTHGAQKIPETDQADPLPLSLVPYPPGLVPDLVDARRELLLLKKSFDVFTNPNAEALLATLDPEEVIIFGVATDICVNAAICDLRRRDRRVSFVEDASRGLNDQRVAACLDAWRGLGVEFTTVEAVIGSF